MIDIHTHLHFKDYDADREAVIARAREAGVEKMILVGTDLKSSRAAIELAEQYEFLYASVGIHPHEYADARFSIEDSRRETEKLKELAKHPKVVAIGECGLDYFSRDPARPITDEQKKMQRDGFMAQMEIAKECGLPSIIHTRPSKDSGDAYEDVFEILKNHSPFITRHTSSFILHCYQGDTEMTRKFLGLPTVWFSFAGNLTYPVKKAVGGTKPARIAPRSGAGGDDIRETVKLVPMERLFVETDCPYLAPQAKRGERNEPAFVVLTAEKVAELKDISWEGLETSLDRNWILAFERGKA